MCVCLGIYFLYHEGFVTLSIWDLLKPFADMTQNFIFAYLMYLTKLPTFTGGSVVEDLPAMQEMRVQSLGWKDPLEEEMATHSSIPVWEILWTEEPGGLQSMGSQKIRQSLATKTTNNNKLCEAAHSATGQLC